MQNDDSTNPGMLWALDGEALWNGKAGAGGKACADCHHDARTSMRGVAARYPAFDKALARPVNIEQRINLCRVQQQRATPLAYESRDLLALTAFVARQSRGTAIETAVDPQLERFTAGGRICSCSGRGSSISVAIIATTTIGTNAWPGQPSRKDIRPAIRCTGWSGNRSVRYSAVCAPACRASAPSLTITARRSWSSWNFI